MTHVIDGNEIADEIQVELQDCIDDLETAGVTPSLATVLMSDDDASETYVSMKQRACKEFGIDGIHHELDASAPAEELFDTVDTLNDDPDVNGILVQMPVPDHVDNASILRRIDPSKDIDGFHPENVGRLVAGDPRFKPCTPSGIQKLLGAADVETNGANAVIVGRSDIVGKPMANLLVQKAAGGNATVTVCHSRTADLGTKTRQADIVIAAAGTPELIDGSMISDGTAVIDVGVNRVDVSEQRSEDSRRESDQSNTEKGYEIVGDVHFESAKAKASAITPVPGGVGPMTIAMLMYNTVKAASIQHNVEIDLP